MATDSHYKTPLKKLAKFFENSRNKWKERAAEKQKRIEYLEQKIRDLEISREKWKNLAKSTRNELKKNSFHKSATCFSRN